MSDYEEADGEVDLGVEPEDEDEEEGLEEAEEAKAEPEAPEDPTLRAANRLRTVYIVPPAERETDGRLHRLEAAQLLAVRAEQIAASGTHFARGAAQLSDPVAIAHQELVEGRCPLVLRRVVGAGGDGGPRGPGQEKDCLYVEEWPVRELALPALPPPPGRLGHSTAQRAGPAL